MTTFQSASSRRLELPPSGGRESTFFITFFPLNGQASQEKKLIKKLKNISYKYTLIQVISLYFARYDVDLTFKHPVVFCFALQIID
jgi:hypothetical protein